MLVNLAFMKETSAWLPLDIIKKLKTPIPRNIKKAVSEENLKNLYTALSIELVLIRSGCVATAMNGIIDPTPTTSIKAMNIEPNATR
ncbi:hypothetical protein MASR2M78_31450 [Treponema sp.]